MFEKYSFSMYEIEDHNGMYFVNVEVFQEEGDKINGGKSLKISRVYSKEEVFEIFEEFEHLFTKEERDDIFSDILDLEVEDKKYQIGRDHDHNVDRTHKTK